MNKCLRYKPVHSLVVINKPTYITLGIWLGSIPSIFAKMFKR